jgi:dihydroorotate dehydrogenase
VYDLVRSFLFRMDAEAAHRWTLAQAARVAQSGWLLRVLSSLLEVRERPLLRVQGPGLAFDNPLGLAAGLDKDGEAVDLWPALGFGFMEVGTVTPGTGQRGNSGPRLERLVEDRAIVNRMGFNNAGAPALRERLSSRVSDLPVGVNIGKSKDTPIDRAVEDYCQALDSVWMEADYVAINVSSPNTPDLRKLQSRTYLETLVGELSKLNRERAMRSNCAPKPMLLKLAPDLSDVEIDGITEFAMGADLTGLIATNTTLSRAGITLKPSIEGGLSGAPLADRAEAVLRRIRGRAGNRLFLIGVGGIDGAERAYRRIRLGASAIQVYTALVYQGPGLVEDILEGLEARLDRDGFSNVSEAVGVDV